jgi:hypothetical protein
VRRGVLDTSVLIASDVQPLPGQLAISVISLAELHYGRLAATLYTRNAEDLRGIEDVLDIVSV